MEDLQQQIAYPANRQTSVELKNRTLWFDGDSSMSADIMADILLAGKSIDGVHPTEINNAVKKFNLYSGMKLELKNDIRELSLAYIIPDEYKKIDLKKYLLKKLLTVTQNDNITAIEDIEIRINRVFQELELFKSYNMEDLVRTVIYIVDKFEENSIVWGTGRGSSCACYSLYLIGLHEVDSVLYNLELTEFFR